MIKYKNVCRLSVGLVPLCLASCWSGGLLTTVGPDYHVAPLATAPQWYAPLPVAHRGDAQQLQKWWAGFQDPVLNQLLAAAQQVSSSVAEAKSRIEQSRANVVGAEGALLPNLDFSVGANSSSISFGNAPFIWNKVPFGLQSSWEVDLFGGLARQEEAARSQLEARNAAWHDARVAVAVEVANAYLDYRYCQSQVQNLQADSTSRLHSAQLTDSASKAGFRAPTEVALANARAADGTRFLLQQQAQCERGLKGLVALTSLSETQMRQVLTAIPERNAKLPKPPEFRLDSVPARVLLQRPDLAAAEREVAEASANIGVEEAKRYPKLSLSGNITPTLQNINGAAFFLAQTWGIGPTLSLPLFDVGKRAADVEVARAHYQAVESKFRSKVRIAVKEVEEALVRLESANQRLVEADKATVAYRSHFVAAQALQRAGLGNLLDVETARRSVLGAESVVKDLQKEHVSAWIALYRAAGGSWNEERGEK